MAFKRPFWSLLRSSALVLFSSLVTVGVVASPMLVAIEHRQSDLGPLTEWTSLGCYSDSIAQRSLRIASFSDVTNMTIEACISYCTNVPSPYPYAGLEFSRECYCDNVINSPALPLDADSCTTTCTGDSTQICGGSNAISIYRAVIPTPLSPPIASIKETVGTFNYTGCFSDAVNGSPRSLANKTISGGATAEICTSTCEQAGFVLAGLEYGGECWCDNYLAGEATQVSDAECDLACDGDQTELCGAGNRLAVYQDFPAA